MNPNARKLLDTIKDPLKKLDAMEKYEERIGICFYDGVMRIEECEQVAIEELHARLAAELSKLDETRAE